MEISGLNQNGSALYWLAESLDGKELLKTLFTHANFREKLLHDDRFLSTLLAMQSSGPNQNRSALYWLAGNPDGRGLLKIVFNNTGFKEKLLRDDRFLSAFLAMEISGPNQNHSAFYWLTASMDGKKLLKTLFNHADFREKILCDGRFLSALLAMEISGHNQSRSALYWLAANSDGKEILKTLFTHSDFREKLLHDDRLLPALLARQISGPNQNCSALYLLTLDTQGLLIFNDWLSCDELLHKLSNSNSIEHLLAALFSEPTNYFNKSAFYNLLDTLTGLKIINKLLTNSSIKLKLLECLNIPVSVDLDWILRSAAGFLLFKFLLKNKRIDLLQLNHDELFNHTDVQVFFRSGLLEPNLFMFLAAINEKNESFNAYLNHPLCNPWATTELGRSLADVIDASSLQEETKKRRKVELITAISGYANHISDNSLVVHFSGIDISQHNTQLTPPDLLPPIVDVPYTLDGVEDTMIQTFHQYIQWIVNTPELQSYHDAFHALAKNEIIRNSQDYPGVFEYLIRWGNLTHHNLQKQHHVPNSPSGLSSDFRRCNKAIRNGFEEMLYAFSSQPVESLVYETLQNASAYFCALIGSKVSLENHLPNEAIQAETGLTSTMGRFDPYLLNLNGTQRRWAVQLAMQVFISEENFIKRLIAPLLTDSPNPVKFSKIMEMYTLYDQSPLFGNHLTVSEFVKFITTGSSLEDTHNYEEYHAEYSLIGNLEEALTTRARLFLRAKSIFTETTTSQKEYELLWAFLTLPEINTLTAENVTMANEFLHKCSIAPDGLAFIKSCIEAHLDELHQINLDCLFYLSDEGHSIFSLLIANPAYAEWLFWYQIKVTQNENGLLAIRFDNGNDARIASLRQKLLSPTHNDKTSTMLEFALNKPGTLFFWLFYFQWDQLRKPLFEAILKFIFSSPRGLYTYDALGPLFFDMQQSTKDKVSETEQILVKSFISARLDEQFNVIVEWTRKPNCLTNRRQIDEMIDIYWNTACLFIPNAHEKHPILTKINPDAPWLLYSLDNPKYMEVFRFLVNHNEDDIRSISELLRRRHGGGHARFFSPSQSGFPPSGFASPGLDH